MKNQSWLCTCLICLQVYNYIFHFRLAFNVKDIAASDPPIAKQRIASRSAFQSIQKSVSHAATRQSCEFTMKKPPHGTRTTLLALPPCSPSPDESASPATLRFSYVFLMREMGEFTKWENFKFPKHCGDDFPNCNKKWLHSIKGGLRPAIILWIQACAGLQAKKKYGILQSFWHNL